MSEVVFRSEVRIERVKGPVRKAYLPAESEPVIFGVHGAVAEHYKVPPDVAEPRATTLDYIVAAAVEEAADAVSLPASGFDQFLQCDATGPLQQIEDLGSFGPAAGGSGLLGAGSLVGRLGFRRRDVRGPFGNTRFRSRLGGCSLGLFLRNRSSHFERSPFLRLLLPSHHMSHSAHP